MVCHAHADGNFGTGRPRRGPSGAGLLSGCRRSERVFPVGFGRNERGASDAWEWSARPAGARPGRKLLRPRTLRSVADGFD